MHKYLQMRVDNHLESWIPQHSAHTNLAQNCDPWRRGADEVTCLITRMFEQFWTASLSAAVALYLDNPLTVVNKPLSIGILRDFVSLH
jgi:hypothetical protein